MSAFHFFASATIAIVGVPVLAVGVVWFLAFLRVGFAADPGAVSVEASEAVGQALAIAVHASFDCLDVDGARSTNDTVLVLANGAAGGALIDAESRASWHQLCDALTSVCTSLAEQMARDAEGATKFVRIRVTGALSDGEARLAARVWG